MSARKDRPFICSHSLACRPGPNLVGRPARSVLFRCAFLLLFLAALGSSAAHATERPFTYTYLSNVLRPGQIEIEPWTTVRLGRRSYYSRLDHRLEFEVGVTERLQWAWYFNFSDVTADVNGTRERDLAWRGVSWEWKYKLLDSVADPIGLALYFEPTFSTTEAELEGKLIVDKRMGRLLLAANAVVEQEWDMRTAGETDRELYLELDVGATYFVAPNLTLGIEARSLNEDGFEYSVLHAGPAVSYVGKRWWIAATFLPQLWAPSGADRGHLDLVRRERYEARFIFGLEL